jgi:hypothetical protein
MKEEVCTQRLVADFFTGQYRISGSVDVRSQRLADQLVNRTTTFLTLEDVYISTIEQPADIFASHDNAVIRKDKIIAVITKDRNDALTRNQRYGSYQGIHLSRVFLVASPFDIRGYLRLSSKRNLRTVFTPDAAPFAPILDGHLRIAACPEAEFSGEAILVSRAHVETFWVEREGGSRG